MTPSERQLEEDLIAKLRELKYEYREDIRDRTSLERNFREKFETLNRVKLEEGEFRRLLEEIVSPDVFTAAKLLRERNSFTRDDGTPLNYTLVDLKDWCKNSFEVVNQLRINTDASHHRYDVVLLLNGLPVVQIELKTLGVNPRRAMEQIVEYKNDPGNGYTKTLLCFVQLFIVSNRSDTWYFANNNARHFAFDAEERFLPIYQLADAANRKITHLDDFAEAFLAKCALAKTLSRYVVLVASEQRLLMMRPYQIYAVQRLVECVDEDCGNGYVWHTTGSGKTLTSFKASTLLKENPHLHKCLFVVDRKDLDRQTREEFNRFQEGSVEENTNTAALVRRLLSDDMADKVIVTTIQKLGLALDPANRRNYADRLATLREKRLVFIFDECHRSQFGENHQAIKEAFPRAQMFGFTGTPIFEKNATYRQANGEEGRYRTTEDLFPKRLHAYTITEAIDDKNVLRFHIDYFKPDGVNPPPAGQVPVKRAVVEAILDRHDAATGGRRFNALFATASINDAIEYVETFRTVQAERQEAKADFVPLNVACVFSPPAGGDKDVQQIQEDLPQEREDNKLNPEEKRAALEGIVAEYNARYGTNHSVGEFDQYYQDVQGRIKDQQYPNRDLPQARKIDLTIVVDMLLTGFDSKYLNTLYVDKNLKNHGLIQAFSRTNRILNATKPYGNVLDFRGQEKAVDEAILLFSGKGLDAAREIWLVDRAPVVVEKLEVAVADLDRFMKSQGLEGKPEDVANLKGDEARAGFVERFKAVQRLQTQLDGYTDLTEEDKAKVEAALPRETLNAFRGVYLSTAQALKERQGKTGDDASPAVENLDFEFVLFASALVDYDYIMGLIARLSGEPKGRETMDREKLIGLIEGDAKFMDERRTIVEYVRSLPLDEALTKEGIKADYERFREAKENEEADGMALRHGLEPERLRAFVAAILGRGIFDGERLTDLLAPLGLGWKARSRAEVALMEELAPMLRRRAGGRDISGLNAYE